ncbi:MAG TPA: hypothetical protein VEW28_03260 [Candidatus Kapabacteria bacterium]|nr:hypothetical protein [Candidatus Kapabacteria bacterium]
MDEQKKGAGYGSLFSFKILENYWSEEKFISIYLTGTYPWQSNINKGI